MTRGVADDIHRSNAVEGQRGSGVRGRLAAAKCARLCLRVRKRKMAGFGLSHLIFWIISNAH